MQTKNIIKPAVVALLMLFLSEGVFGLGLYWPFLLLLVDWEGKYWFGLVFGIFLSVLVGIRVGLPSLVLVSILGLVSYFVGMKKSSQYLLIFLGVLFNFAFDKSFGLNWNFGETLIVLGVSFWAVRGLDKQETIRVNY